MDMSFVDNLFDLKGRVAVVTGGAGALGGLMARGLARVGARVAVLDLNAERANQTAAEIVAAGGEAIGVAASVLDKDQLTEKRDEIIARWGRIDILINAAGGNVAAATLPPDGVVFDMPIDAFRRVFDLNLLGTVLPTQVVGAAFAKQGKGVVINLSSMTATRVVSRVFGYSLAKAAVDNFTRWMAVELARRYGEGLRVNAIAPGFFIGDQNRALLLNDDGSLTPRAEAIIAHTPMNRFGEHDEILGTIIWLCSDASKFVTGTVVPIDGGFNIDSSIWP